MFSVLKISQQVATCYSPYVVRPYMYKWTLSTGIRAYIAKGLLLQKVWCLYLTYTSNTADPATSVDSSVRKEKLLRLRRHINSDFMWVNTISWILRLTVSIESEIALIFLTEFSSNIQRTISVTQGWWDFQRSYHRPYKVYSIYTNYIYLYT